MNKHTDSRWIGNGVSDGRRRRLYYSSVVLDGHLTVTIGDTVLIQPTDPSVPLYVAQVVNMYDGADGARAHVRWFGRGVDTVLGEAGDPAELFLLTECEDRPLLSIWRKCSVTFVPQQEQDTWRLEGGKRMGRRVQDDGVSFWYRLHYTPATARFEHPATWPECPSSQDEELAPCLVCCSKKQAEVERKPRIQEKQADSLDIQSIVWKSRILKVGDCVYLAPSSVHMKFKKETNVSRRSSDHISGYDENVYSEYYRKKEGVDTNNNDAADPFNVVIIKRIFKDFGHWKIKVQVFYRPEDTHEGASAAESSYYNELYWTDQDATVNLDAVMGKCYVKYMEDSVSDQKVEAWTEEGPDRWFFREWYNPINKQFMKPPCMAQMIGCIDNVMSEKEVDEEDEQFPSYPSVTQKLRCLDIFSGCGGLSHGLHESGVAESKWAVEIFQPAAEAYKLNNPECTVFGDDCNLLLRRAIEGTTHNEKGQRIPAQGEVDLMCGGPPCQGFSQMNRFTNREYSQFKNSLVATYLSYCDFYRPRFFILENVRNFASFKKGMVLKLCLATLIKLGYQATFAILQAGQFGVAQTRRRAIILAAAPGETLPLYPEPRHVFSPQACSLSVQIDEVRYTSNVRWTESAPFRTCTVRDTMSDLPRIRNGADKSEISYKGEARSNFQKKIRKGSEVLRDHVTKNMAPLIEARFELIPTAPGSDWRDLPNKAMTLKDGSTVKKLRYEFEDIKNGRSSTGAKRGVCGCMEGGKCDPADKQDRTLIPWCLPHTSARSAILCINISCLTPCVLLEYLYSCNNLCIAIVYLYSNVLCCRHNQWAGLYGRVEWDGFFSTTITNPEPMGKQGRVLHPDQNR